MREREKLPPKIDSEGALVRYLILGRRSRVINRKGEIVHFRRVAAFVYDADDGIEKFIPISGKTPEGVQILTIDQVREEFGESASKEAQKTLSKAERRRIKTKELRLLGRKTS